VLKNWPNMNMVYARTDTHTHRNQYFMIRGAVKWNIKDKREFVPALN
jgi:hypothetical protein